MSTIPSREEARFADATAQPEAEVALLAPIARLIVAHERTQSLLASASVPADWR